MMNRLPLLIAASTLVTLAGCSSTPFVAGNTENNTGLAVFSVGYSEECTSNFYNANVVIDAAAPENKPVNVILENVMSGPDIEEDYIRVYAREVDAGDYVTDRIVAQKFSATSLLFAVPDFQTFDVEEYDLSVKPGEVTYWGSFVADVAEGECTKGNFKLTRSMDHMQRDVEFIMEKQPAAAGLLK